MINHDHHHVVTRLVQPADVIVSIATKDQFLPQFKTLLLVGEPHPLHALKASYHITLSNYIK